MSRGNRLRKTRSEDSARLDNLPIAKCGARCDETRAFKDLTSRLPREKTLMPQKLIIDADPGIGDALAIAIALADPELDVIALTAVGGAVSAVQAGRNLHALLEAIDPPKWPRIGQAEARATDGGSGIEWPHLPIGKISSDC